MRPMTQPQPGRTRKGGQTKERIVDCALRMFRQYGYDRTTMRGIAEEAGVSLGNAYYYFKSKDHLIQAYYEESHEVHVEACETLLASEKNFKKRLHGTLYARIDTSMPYHRFSSQLFKTAADPESPLSPFSADQSPVRDKSIALFARVFEESSMKITGKLKKELPGLLWTYQMGIILYWVHDISENSQKTFRLIDRSVKLIQALVELSGLPLIAPFRKKFTKLMLELLPGGGTG